MTDPSTACHSEGRGFNPFSRFLRIRLCRASNEDDDLDEAQLVPWIEQASNLPGEKM
jgi:hypothetical protein